MIRPRLAPVRSIGIVVAIAAMTGLFAGVSANSVFAALIVGSGLVLSYRLARHISIPEDQRWLPRLVTLAFAAKIGSAVAHYFVTISVYGIGDSIAYHENAREFAEGLRHGDLVTGRWLGIGVRTVETVAGLVYTAWLPDLFGGFLVFSAIAFGGTIAFYLAFRTVAPANQLFPFAVMVFFMPSLLFWTATIGKDSLMFLAIGLLSFAVARSQAGALRSSGIVGLVALALAFVIRPHVGLLLASSVAVALIVRQHARDNMSSRMESAMGLTIWILALVLAYPLVLSSIGAEEGALNFADAVVQRTSIGGSQIDAVPATNPASFASAAIRVLFRPTLLEAVSLAQILTAMESLAIVVYVVAKAPTLWSNRRLLWREPLFAFGMSAVLTFVVIMSPVSNLGILVRQRAQVLPLLLMLLIGLGWSRVRSEEQSRSEGLRSSHA